MGIERFFSAIQENNITNLESSFTNILDEKIHAKYLYIDFNSIVYIVSHKVISDFNYLLFKIITNKINDKNARRIISEYNVEEEEDLSLKKFKSNIDKNIDDIIIQKVKEYVINILSNYIEPNELLQLYIAIDGVPSKSKMVEQRKRRYMGTVIEKIKSKIFIKHEESLSKNDPNRYIYEINRVRWSTINITPGTEFMDKLVIMLTSQELNTEIKITCPKINKYIFSGPYEPGEGEKKIVDHLRGQEHSKPSDYVIYSPDSDVTLLCLLLNTALPNNPKISRIKILRHNQQKGNYDVIDIDKLSDNLYKYITKDINENKILDKDSVINDTVFILTVFGNDFVPKIQAFDVKRDFSRIIDKYADVLNKNIKNGEFNYLIVLDENNNKRINLSMFKDIIKILKKDEGGNLQKVYMSSHYQNYDKLKKIIDADHLTFTEKLNDFLSKLRSLNANIEKIDKTNINEFKRKWLSNEHSEFISKLKKLTRISDSNTSSELFIDSYIEYYIREKKFPRVAVYFRSYEHSLKSDFHTQKLNKSLDYLNDKSLDITEYDKEIYKFDNMLDEYKKKLNAYKLNLGYVGIDPKTYTWKTEKITKSVKRYYKEYFGIDDISIENDKMNKLIKEYLDGLLWVFDFYFNNFDEDINRKHADTWFYPYNYSPLITQIYEYLLTVNELEVEFNEFKVYRGDYFNCLEHLMYVSPAPNILNIIPKDYHKFAKSSAFYPNLDKIVDEIWEENPLTNDEIDCRGVLFLNKCHLTKIKIDRNFEKDKKFIKELRKIDLPVNIDRRKGTYKPDNSGNINIFNYGTNEQTKQTGGKKIKEWIEQYSINKTKYLDSGDYKYKKLYKMNKYQLMNLIEY